MFKNLLIFRIGPAWATTLLQLEEKLQEQIFVECGPTQDKSIGWTSPRGEAHGALVESVGGQWLLKLMMERKSVPASVIDRHVQERTAHIETTTGRKPGKKETRELKDDARLELLPMAFTQRGATLVWIDPVARLLIIDASSQGKADEVLTALSKGMDNLGAMPIQTMMSPVAVMSDWLLSQEPPASFSIDRECELKASDQSKAVVRYAHHALDIQEVQQHIQSGKLPTRLAMTWAGRVSFVLTNTLQIKKLAFVEGVFENNESAGKADRFDADVAIGTGEISKLIPDLVQALGGEMAV